MAWNFRRRIKIIPGVHLNLSRKGISTSIGVRGASMTLGKNGAYVNRSIPGLGIYNRQVISNNSAPEAQPPPTTERQDNIFSVDVQEITSQDMQGIKEAIISAHQQRIELRKDLKGIRSSLLFSKIINVLSYLFLISVFSKKIAASLKADISAKKNAIEQIVEQIENCYVNLDIEFDADIKEKYEKVMESFTNLSTSKKIWDITGAYEEDTKITRSSAATSVKKVEVQFGVKELEDVKSQFAPLWMKNHNGADLYFYPSFVVVYSSRQQFALIGLNELELYHSAVRFIETGTVPADSEVIDHTWAKVNKNGSPDKRFKDNYQIPVVRYGGIELLSQTGLKERYQFSNYEASEAFATSLSDYQQTYNSLKNIEA